MSTALGICIYCVLATPLVQAAEAPIYLGVLEQPIAQPGDPSSSRDPHVRVAFRFLSGAWSAMPHEALDVEGLAALQKLYPAALSWTVALDGKKFGVLESRRPDPATAGGLLYKDIGLQPLTPESKVPTSPDPAKAFSTWMGTPRYRPLVVISKPNYADPDGWKRFRPAAALGKQAHAAFRVAVKGQKGSYSDDAIHLQPKGYLSSRGDSLIALQLKAANSTPAWFLIANGLVHWIANGLTLVDAGDYDGDGASELLFQKSGYNRDGYLLFHVRDQSKLEFDWSYH